MFGDPRLLENRIDIDSQVTGIAPCEQPSDKDRVMEGDVNSELLSPSQMLGNGNCSNHSSLLDIFNNSSNTASPKRKVARMTRDNIDDVPERQDQGSCVSDDESDNERTLIIEQVVEGNQGKFLNNDAKFANALRHSEFKNVDVVEIKKNYGRNIAVVKMKDVDRETFEGLLRVTKLEEWHVRCRLPRTDTIHLGKIGPISPAMSDAEIYEEMSLGNPNIVNAKRIIKRNRDKTRMVRIEFSSPLPKYVRFAYQRYQVEKYETEVTQCYNCQGYGHGAFQCTARPKCVVCAGRHPSRECTYKNAGNRPKCCNCGGSHTANYGGCPRFTQAKKVEKVRSETKLSYRDALSQVITQRTAQKQSQVPQQRPVPSGQSVGGARPRTKEASTQTQEASTQTQEANVTSEPNQAMEARDDLLISRIVNLVLGLLKHISNESPIDSNKVLEVVRSTTGVNLKTPKEKTKPPPGNTRPPGQTDTKPTGMDGLEDCSGPLEQSESRTEEEAREDATLNPFTWVTKGKPAADHKGKKVEQITSGKDGKKQEQGKNKEKSKAKSNGSKKR